MGSRYLRRRDKREHQGVGDHAASGRNFGYHSRNTRSRSSSTPEFAFARASEHLGGYDAISVVVDVFLTEVWADPVVGRFFVGMGTDTRNQLRQKNKNLLCFNTGGPCKKINRPLKFAHEGLAITNQEFDIVVNHLATTLKKFKVPQREHDEVMTKIGNLRSYIVEEKS